MKRLCLALFARVLKECVVIVLCRALKAKDVETLLSEIYIQQQHHMILCDDIPP